MAQSLYLAATDPYCGKSLISLGVLDYVLRMTRRVAVFRPVIRHPSDDGRDKNIDLLLSYFGLDVPYEDTYALTLPEANDLLAHQHFDEFLNRVIGAYQKLTRQYDFVLCIGTDLVGAASAFEFDLNVETARSLDAPVLILTSALDRSLNELMGTLHPAIAAFRTRGCPIVGLVVSRVEPGEISTVRETIEREFDLQPQELSIIPNDPLLASPTIKEIAAHLDAEVLYGHDQLQRQAMRYMVIAMRMENYLDRLTDNALLITPGDRGEIILSAVLAHQSHSYPPIAGLLLTANLLPSPQVRRLLDGLRDVPPILCVQKETYETATDLYQVRSYITADNPAKIEAALKLMAEHIDTEPIAARYGQIEPRGISPRMFLYSLKQKASSDRRHIVLPEGGDERILRAAAALVEQNVVQITLLGDEQEIRSIVARIGVALDFDKIPIIDPATSPKLEAYTHTLYEARRARGMTIEHAHDLMHDVSYFGTMMVHRGDADGMVSGAAHTTAHTILPALQFIKTRPGISIISSVFFMCLEDRVLVYGDCAVNPRPTATELADIAIASADTARLFGIEPRVALLSYSTGESGTGEEVDRVRAATELAHERRRDLLLEGPIQYDAAVDEAVARSKMPGSQVAGRATVLIFPDLNTGNNTYKAVQRETGAIAVGPILQGLNKPVNDLSRGCTVEDIINTVAITAIQAQGMGGG